MTIPRGSPESPQHYRYLRRIYIKLKHNTRNINIHNPKYHPKTLYRIRGLIGSHCPKYLARSIELYVEQEYGNCREYRQLQRTYGLRSYEIIRD